MQCSKGTYEDYGQVSTHYSPCSVSVLSSMISLIYPYLIIKHYLNLVLSQNAIIYLISFSLFYFLHLTVYILLHFSLYSCSLHKLLFLFFMSSSQRSHISSHSYPILSLSLYLITSHWAQSIYLHRLMLAYCQHDNALDATLKNHSFLLLGLLCFLVLCLMNVILFNPVAWLKPELFYNSNPSANVVINIIIFSLLKCGVELF